MVKSGLSAGLLLPDNHLPLPATLLCLLVNMLQVGRNRRLFQRCCVVRPTDGAIAASVNSKLHFHSHALHKNRLHSFIKPTILSQLKVDCCGGAGVCGRGTQIIPAARVTCKWFPHCARWLHEVHRPSGRSLFFPSATPLRGHPRWLTTTGAAETRPWAAESDTHPVSDAAPG